MAQKSLTEQKLRDKYVTAPASAFDPSKLKENQLYWLQNGEFGVKTADGTAQLPMGSSSKPVPSLNTEEISLGGVTKTSWPAGGAKGVRFASEFSGTNGGAQIQAAIDDLPAEGGVVVVGPDGPDSGSEVTDSAALYSFPSSIWLLTSTLTVPSDVSLVLQGAYLVCQDGLNDNFIRNASARSGDSTRDNNIHVWGDPHATVHYNGANRDDTVTDATRPEFNYNKVDNFSVANLTVIDSHGWNFKPEDSENGLITNIHFDMRGGAGNQDGVHPLGCRQIAVTECTGVCYDDWLAPSMGKGGQAETNNNHAMDGFFASDIQGICRDASNPVRVLSNGDATCHNIRVQDSFFDNAPSNRFGLTSNSTNVTGTPSITDFYNIVLDNVTFTHQGFVPAQPVYDVTFNNVAIENGLNLFGTNGARVEYMVLSDCRSSLQGNQTVQLNGPVGTLRIDGLLAEDETASQQGSYIINSTSSGSVDDLQMTDVTAVSLGAIMNNDPSATYASLPRLTNIARRGGTNLFDAGAAPDVPVLVDDVEHLPSVASGGTVTINGGSPAKKGIVVRDVTNGEEAVFLAYSGGVNSISESTSTHFSVGGGTNNVDVAYDSTNTQHEITNNSGASMDLQVGYSMLG